MITPSDQQRIKDQKARDELYDERLAYWRGIFGGDCELGEINATWEARLFYRKTISGRKDLELGRAFVDTMRAGLATGVPGGGYLS